MDKVVATVLMSPKQLSNLPDRIALRIQTILGTPLVIYDNDNLYANTSELCANADEQYTVPRELNSNQLKNRLLCRYDNQLFALLADKHSSPQKINAYDITSQRAGEIEQAIGTTFFTTDNMSMPRETFQSLLDQYTHESLPRQVTVGPISLQTTRKHKILPKNGQREKRKAETETKDRKDLEKAIARITKQQQDIRYNTSQHI